MKKPPAAQQTTLRSVTWAAAALAAGILLNCDRVPPWVSCAALSLLGWRLCIAWRPTRFTWFPGSIARTLIAFTLIAGVLLRFRTLNGLSAGTALLILMGACKLLETRSRRDELIVIGCALFLLLAACLDRQSLVRTPLYLLHVWLCCTAIAIVSYTPRAAHFAAAGVRGHLFDDRGAALLAGRALLMALPLALVLFLFFPRLAGAFWALPRPEAATTGLSDTMTPGSITELTTSYDVAFRATFAALPPPPQERYWRGPVMHEFDGSTWRRTFGSFYRQTPLEFLGLAYRYRIALEPSSQRWWFALDTPQSKPDSRVSFTDDYELVSAEPVTEATSYTAVSYTSVRSSAELKSFERRRDTRQPANRNPRSQAFARELRARAASDEEFVRSVLEFLRTGGFEYSLTPPPLGPDAVDDFLFSTRRGFCAHFASAFVALMRAAGVPAHVVTGYLGGEWNPIGGYFAVHQSDAHAWAEIWLEGRGWSRVDPTAVVAPERLNRGILDLLPDAVSAQARMLHASPLLTSILQRWDAANTWWNDHVVKFDFRSQLDVLRWLGISAPDASHVVWAFAAGLLLWLPWIAWQFGRGAPTTRPDRLARAYSRLCRKLGRAGIGRALHQGPLSYADTVTDRRPDLDPPVRALLELYARLRFGAAAVAPDPADVSAFERGVARLRVGNAVSADG